MKSNTYLKVFILGLAVSMILTGATIDWGREGSPVLKVKRTMHDPPKTVEFGLRDDGVVVWREITHGQDVTNSPAEISWMRVYTNYYFFTNNLVLTNNWKLEE